MSKGDTKGWRKGKLKDIRDQRFGRLVVLQPAGYYATPNGKYTQALWECVCDCGKVLKVQGGKLRAGHTKSCGCYVADVAKSRVGSLNQSWRGGRTKTEGGYIRVKAYGHPASQQDYVLEHRLVMETFLGRYLTEDETVHHKNGDRSDNRIENLELRAGPHGKGQRVQDLVAYAKEILARYGEDGQDASPAPNVNNNGAEKNTIHGN